MDEIFQPSKNIKLFFGTEKAIELRMRGWEEAKEENLILVAPESTPKKKVKFMGIKRGQILQNKKINTRFIENITTLKNLEKNLMRLDQGLEVRYYPHHGFSMSIIDKKVILLEVSIPSDELLNIRIEDKDFANQMANYFNILWERAKPLDEKLISDLRAKLSHG